MKESDGPFLKEGPREGTVLPPDGLVNCRYRLSTAPIRRNDAGAF